jgi:hypothetical protein
VTTVEIDTVRVISFSGSCEITWMVNWQVTAATLRCEVIGEEVTLLVYKDWSVKCTAYSKLTVSGKTVVKTGQGRCEGTDCKVASDYRRKLQSEEREK